jgi:biopolymer transport protein ExbD
MVLVNASGDVLFNDDIITVDQITAKARQLEASNPNMVFSVQTDRKTKYRDYINVVDQLTAANVKKLALIGTQ